MICGWRSCNLYMLYKRTKSIKDSLNYNGDLNEKIPFEQYLDYILVKFFTSRTLF